MTSAAAAAAACRRAADASPASSPLTAERGAQRPRPVRPPEDARPASASTRAVLLVDDELALHALISRIYARIGVRVVSAFTREAALEAARAQGPFELVLVDLRFPTPEEGLALTSDLLARLPGVPHVVITGYDRNKWRVEPGRRGAVALLQKPIQAAVFVDLVQRPPAEATPSSRTSDPVPAAIAMWLWHVRRPLVLRRDPNSVRAWGEICSSTGATKGETKLGEICRRVDLTAEASCRLARMAYALNEHHLTSTPLRYFFDAQDSRTVDHLLERAGISEVNRPPSIDEFLTRQRFVPVDHPAIGWLRLAMRGR